MEGDSDTTALEQWEKPIIIANTMLMCRKCKIPIMGYGRKLRCKQCNEEYTDSRYANYIAFIAEMFQNAPELKFHVLRIHIPFADSIFNVFKRAFHVEEVYRKPVETKNERTGAELRVIEIVLEKYVR